MDNVLYADIVWRDSDSVAGHEGLSMNDLGKTKEQLIAELAAVRKRHAEILQTEIQLRNRSETLERELSAFGHIEAATFSIQSSTQHDVVNVHNASVDVNGLSIQRKALADLRHSVDFAPENIQDLLPHDNVMDQMEFVNIVDVYQLQSMMNDFFKLTRIGVAILDLNGRILVSSGWQDICINFHRKHPISQKNCAQSDTILSGNLKQGEFRVYKCMNNMWDIVSPIFAGGRHLANLFLGQFFFEDEEPDIDIFMKQAEIYGFDKEQYLDALKKTPRWNRDTVDTVMNFYSKLASMVGQLSYINLTLAGTLANQKQAERKLKESEARYRLITERIQDVFWMTSPTMDKILYVSPAYERIWGRPVEGIIQNPKSFLDSIHPEDQSRVIDRLLNQQRETLPFEGSYRIIRPDGSMRWIEDRGYPILDDNGVPYLLAGVARDITDLAKARESLRHSEEHYHSLFRNMAEGFAYHRMIFDDQGTPLDFVFLNVNREFQKLSGLNDVIGKTITEVMPGFRQSYNKLLQIYGDVASGGQPCRFEFYVEQLERFFDISAYSPQKGYFCTVFQDITKRKALEKELMDSRSRLINLLDVTSNIFWEVDKSGAYTFVGSKIQDVLGYTSQEVIGRSFFDLMHPEDAEKLRDLFKMIGARKQPFSFVENRNLHKDGREIILESSGVPILDSNGLLKGYMGIDRDITDRKRAENALRESEEKFASVFHSAPVMISLSTVQDGTFLDLNDKFLEVTGYSRDEVIGKKSTEIGLMSTAQRDRLLHRIITEGRIGESETRLISKNGKEICCLGSSELIKTQQGRLVLSIAKDITERKKMEESLRTSEQMLKTILATSPIGIAMTRNREIVWINETGLRMFGYDDETELVGKSARMMYPSENEYLGISQTLYADLNKKPVEQAHTTFARKDGSIFDASVRAKYVDPNSSERLIITVISDISDQLRNEREKEALRTQFLQAQKMEAMGNLAGGIAHDFNNLLQIVLGYSDIALKTLDQSHEIYPSLKKIHLTAIRGAELVKGLLTFSRKVETTLQSTNLNEEIIRVSDLLSRVIPKNIRISLQLEDLLPLIEANSSQISQILLNLAVNAKDAMPDGGALEIRTNSLTLREHHSGDHVDIKPGKYICMHVRDTGHGMTPDTLTHVFEPFFSTKGPDKGTGLGLATVYGIVRQHGGHITCNSEAGRGTLFTIYFPQLPQHEAEESVRLQDRVLKGNETILLVDDEESARDIGKKVLSIYGYKVLTARNGIQALNIYRKYSDSISLIILDLIMPEMNGQQFLSEIVRLYPDVKVVVASGQYIDDQDKKNLSIAAVKAFIDKPYSMNQILNAVRETLDTNV